MCGLAGVFGSFQAGATKTIIEKMLAVQSHRGPDGQGVWHGVVQGTNIGLGHRRLKVIDLSEASAQPMLSEDGRYILIYNGEIYNYLELRKELEATGVQFSTQGDTEVLLKALIQWGEAALPRLNGMWALVLLDQSAGTVLLARDRFGIKPLYTYYDDRGLLIASEIKAILEVASGKFRINPAAANAYLCQSLLCTSPMTFFAGIEELPAGNFAKISIDLISDRRLKPQRYWSVPLQRSNNLTEDELIECVRQIFLDSVRMRLRSDVPVGILLSGGIDSSAITAAVHVLDPSRYDIKIISAVGMEGEQDEQPFIDTVGKYFNRQVDKVVLNYSPDQALEFVTEATWYNDEPIGSFSTVAYYLMMKRAKELGVTVLLTGQGADESLCGYKKYVWFYLQQLIASKCYLKAGKAFRDFLKSGMLIQQFSFQDAKRYLPRSLVLRETDVRGPALQDSGGLVDLGLPNNNVIERQCIDLERLSVPSLVHYEDRMSMALSREVRLPFLDYRFVSLLLPVQVEYKLRHGWTKWLFRRAIEPWLPNESVWRKDKQHFPVPQSKWLRRELREQILRLIDSEWVSERLGLIDRRKFQERYQKYISQAFPIGQTGESDIFVPIALELWARRFEAYLIS
jgi:asparagine synthase (glutamine-hydrolysing)